MQLLRSATVVLSVSDNSLLHFPVCVRPSWKHAPLGEEPSAEDDAATLESRRHLGAAVGKLSAGT